MQKCIVVAVVAVVVVDDHVEQEREDEEENGGGEERDGEKADIQKPFLIQILCVWSDACALANLA